MVESFQVWPARANVCMAYVMRLWWRRLVREIQSLVSEGDVSLQRCQMDVKIALSIGLDCKMWYLPGSWHPILLVAHFTDKSNAFIRGLHSDGLPDLEILYALSMFTKAYITTYFCIFTGLHVYVAVVLPTLLLWVDSLREKIPLPCDFVK